MSVPTFKRYLVKASSDNEHFDSNLNFAIIEFSGELLAKLSSFRRSFLAQLKRHGDISTWTVFDSSASFCSYATTETMLGEKRFEEMSEGDDDEPFKLSATDVIDLEKFNVELSDEMVLSVEGVGWKVYPRHSQITVGTSFLPWTWFTQCSNCGLRKEEHARGRCLFSPTRYCAEAPGLVSRGKTRREHPSTGALPKLRDAGKGSR